MMGALQRCTGVLQGCKSALQRCKGVLQGCKGALQRCEAVYSDKVVGFPLNTLQYDTM